MSFPRRRESIFQSNQGRFRSHIYEGSTVIVTRLSVTLVNASDVIPANVSHATPVNVLHGIAANVSHVIPAKAGIYISIKKEIENVQKNILCVYPGE